MNIWEIFTGKKHRTGPKKSDDTDETVDRKSITSTLTEWEHVEDMANRHGISASSYVRLLIMIDQLEGGLTSEKVHKKRQLKNDLEVS